MTLDPLLSDLLKTRADNATWEEVFSGCTAVLSTAYKLSVPGQADVIKKGKLSPIQLNVAQRTGSKKVNDLV